MNKNSVMVIIAAVLVIWILSGTAGAQDVKSRMRDRLPEIAALKAKGVVGENNLGFLEIRTGNGAHKQIVKAENNDRREVYKAIAAKAGTSLEVVGKRRAIQIAEKAGPGEWLQSADGQWYQKR